MKPSNSYLKIRPTPGTFVYSHSSENTSYKARFSRIYRPAALNFFKAFDVIYVGYWQRYQLISYQAVNLYQFLTYLAQADLAFTIAGLAAETKQSKQTITSLLDVLENAELLHRFCVVDCQGRPDFLVLRTPLLETADALTARKRELIARAGEEIPETFLSTECDRLKKAITQNAVRARRRKQGRSDGDFRRYWKASLKLFDNDRHAALKFDNVVADLVTQFRGRDITLEAWNKSVAHECRVASLPYSPRVAAISHQQRAFYEWFSSGAAPKVGANKPAAVNHDQDRKLYRDMLANGYTLKMLSKQFAASYSPDDWKRITKGLMDV